MCYLTFCMLQGWLSLTDYNQGVSKIVLWGGSAFPLGKCTNCYCSASCPLYKIYDNTCFYKHWAKKKFILFHFITETGKLSHFFFHMLETSMLSLLTRFPYRRFHYLALIIIYMYTFIYIYIYFYAIDNNVKGSFIEISKNQGFEEWIERWLI